MSGRLYASSAPWIHMKGFGILMSEYPSWAFAVALEAQRKRRTLLKSLYKYAVYPLEPHIGHYTIPLSTTLSDYTTTTHKSRKHILLQQPLLICI